MQKDNKKKIGMDQSCAKQNKAPTLHDFEKKAHFNKSSKNGKILEISQKKAVICQKMREILGILEPFIEMYL